MNDQNDKGEPGTSRAESEAVEAREADVAKRPPPKRILNTVYWALWFVAVPFALACASFCAAARPSNWRSAASR